MKLNNIESLLNTFNRKIPNINDLLIFCTENNCSDLYIKVGEQPFISRFGVMYQVPSIDMTSKLWNDWAKYAISSESNAKYVRQKMLDFSYTIQVENKEVSEYRYRVTSGYSTGKNIATFRMISKTPPSFDHINYPKDIIGILRQISLTKRKITLFVGPTGSGKSIIHNQKLNVKRKIKA